MTLPEAAVIFSWPPSQENWELQHTSSTVWMASLIWPPLTLTTVLGARFTMQIWPLPCGVMLTDLGFIVTLPKFALKDEEENRALVSG